jgi:hypothetical protein
LELLFVGVQELQVGSPGEYWGASGSIEIKIAPVEARLIRMEFDSELRVVSESLFYKVRTECLGVQARLKSEVPSSDAVPASVLDQNWRQCSACCDAWEWELSEIFSYCPSCGLLTELHACKVPRLPKNNETGPPQTRKSPPQGMGF